MRIAVSLMFFLITICHAYSEDIITKVIEASKSRPVGYSTISIEYADTICGGMTDMNGIFSFNPRSFPLTLTAKGFCMNEAKLTLKKMPESVVTISLTPGEIGLNEVEVVGRLTSQTEYGISYNMAGNKRAQSENMMQALSYVPLVDVDADGGISVQNSSSFSLYLNGRPYEMAQTSPKIFLETLPASSIAKVEVITHPNIKYGADSKKYILNIILKSAQLQGYAVNFNATGNTQPSANGSATGMLKRDKINAAISYNYILNGQRHQPNDITYKELDSRGEVMHIWGNSGKGNGDWHTHTMRAMLKWDIDSVNTLYADAHGRIEQTNFVSDNIQKELFPIHNNSETLIENRSEFTSGAAEANLIYRSYFKSNKQTEKLTAGYHYTYNPDKRQIRQKREKENTAYPEYLQLTDGGLNAHTGILSYLLKPSRRHSLRITASDIYRNGRTKSFYSEGFHDGVEKISMAYKNNIAALNLTWSGWIKKFYCTASLKGNYDYFEMKLHNTPSLNYKRNRLYFLPSVSVFWRPNHDNALYLDYSTTLIRPGIKQLNPFESTTNDHSIKRGNPNLKAEYDHRLSMFWYLSGITDFMLVSSIQYSHMKNIIMPNYYAENERMIYTYSNLGKGDLCEISLDAKYTPLKWFSLSVNGALGKRWLNNKNPILNQNDITCRITPRIDFYLPNHFRAGAKYGFHKNLSDPYNRQTSLTLYSFFLAKSFLSGRLNLSITANSPFRKYRRSQVITTLPPMITVQNNYITARSFGISMSYSFSGGQKVKIERDNSLDSTDQNTGVK